MHEPMIDFTRVVFLWGPLLLFSLVLTVVNLRTTKVPNMVTYPAALYFLGVHLFLPGSSVLVSFLGGFSVFFAWALLAETSSELRVPAGVAKAVIVFAIAAGVVVGLGTYVLVTATFFAVRRYLSSTDDRRRAWGDREIPALPIVLVGFGLMIVIERLAVPHWVIFF